MIIMIMFFIEESAAGQKGIFMILVQKIGDSIIKFFDLLFSNIKINILRILISRKNID